MVGGGSFPLSVEARAIARRDFSPAMSAKTWVTTRRKVTIGRNYGASEAGGVCGDVRGIA